MAPRVGCDSARTSEAAGGFLYLLKGHPESIVPGDPSLTLAPLTDRDETVRRLLDGQYITTVPASEVGGIMEDRIERRTANPAGGCFTFRRWMKKQVKMLEQTLD